MALDDVYRVTVTAGGQNSIYQNTYALRMKSETNPDASTFAGFVTAAVALWRPQQITTITYNEWSALQLWGSAMTIVANECRREGGASFAGSLAALPGLLSGDGLPPQSAMVMTLTTGLAGRRKRGRLYGFGQGETNQIDGAWSTTYLSTMTTAANTFFNLYKHPGGTDPNFTIGVWSERMASGCVPATPPQKGHVPRDTPQPAMAFTPVTGFIIRPVVFSQRRRTRGVGR